MSLTKSIFRVAAGGNFDTSTSAALAPGQARRPANSNPAGKQRPSLIGVRQAGNILSKLCFSTGFRANRQTISTAVNQGEFTAKSQENSALGDGKQVFTG